MCNRYRLRHSKQYLAERFGAGEIEIEDRPRYNIAPTQPVLIVRKEQGKKVRHSTMRWGLIPSWAKDMGIGNRTLNARSETVTTTPAFRDSILTKRCLIPADGFYEWRKMGSVKRVEVIHVGVEPHVVFLRRDDDGHTVVQIGYEGIRATRPTVRRMQRLHPRQPRSSKVAIRDILQPYDANLMRRYPVSRKLNNSRIDDAESALPVTLDTPTQGQLF